jgi:hypothetical protein
MGITLARTNIRIAPHLNEREGRTVGNHIPEWADMLAPGTLAEKKIGDRRAGKDCEKQYSGSVRHVEHACSMLCQEDQYKSSNANPYAVPLEETGHGKESLPVEINSIAYYGQWAVSAPTPGAYNDRKDKDWPPDTPDNQICRVFFLRTNESEKHQYENKRY